MSKKIIIILSAIVLTVLAYLAINSFYPKPIEGQKSIYISIYDETTNTIVLEKEAFKTTAKTLGEFFDEKHDGITISLVGSPLNRAIEVFNGIDSGLNNPEGPWLLYSSDNNQSCVSNGFCLGVDSLPIYDGDYFSFKLVSTFDFLE